ncbi:hypothetical protein QAD02_011160 [Eretmocerus hayati]|uniref:Uncharacterized protein n=1 Tax=Eretmocerus hayati TaxID=131215 RepID=A0ACC2NWB2_9HYME|nr:hypothetical protein QAD02_011160 [Eretmocerus hayati]
MLTRIRPCNYRGTRPVGKFLPKKPLLMIWRQLLMNIRKLHQHLVQLLEFPGLYTPPDKKSFIRLHGGDFNHNFDVSSVTHFFEQHRPPPAPLEAELGPNSDLLPELPLLDPDSDLLPELPLLDPDSDLLPKLPLLDSDSDLLPELPLLDPDSDLLPELPLLDPDSDLLSELPLPDPDSDLLPKLPLLDPDSDLLPELPLLYPDSDLLPELPLLDPDF